MKKEKGFTLIELLAVIVILAVIALIVTPMVMSTINSAREGAAKSSAGEFSHAVETKLAVSAMNGADLANGIYSVVAGNIQNSGGTVLVSDIAQHVDTINGEIEVNGINVANARLIVKNGSNTYTFTIGADATYTLSTGAAALVVNK